MKLTFAILSQKLREINVINASNVLGIYNTVFTKVLIEVKVSFFREIKEVISRKNLFSQNIFIIAGMSKIQKGTKSFQNQLQ